MGESMSRYCIINLPYLIVCAITLCLCLTGCGGRATDPLKYIDADNKVERNEFEDRFWPERSKRDEAKESKQVDDFLDEMQQEPGSEAPDLTNILASPLEPPIHNDRLISIAVTEDVPLKDVFMEIGRLADISIEVDPKIEGGILLRAKEQPLMDIIERIAEMTSLRYSNHNGVLRIERDTPYLVNYTVDYLNMIRANTNSIQTSMQLGGGGGGSGSSNSSSNSSSGGGSNGSSSSVTTGSSSSVTSSSSVDLWQEVQTNINSILSQNSNKKGDKAAAGKGADGDTKTGADGTQQAYMSINKVAGIISVFANAHQQKSVSKYLGYVKATSSAQVLIEAKIVEVSLTKEYHSGIAWTQFFKRANELGTALNFKGENPLANNGFVINVLGKQVGRKNATAPTEYIKALESFGTVTTLSSPRLHAMNNQQSLLSFVQNYVYFTLNLTTTPATSSTSTGGAITQQTQQVTSTINTVPLGVVLNIQPSINIETQEITMNIRPTLTRRTSTVQDPATLYLLSISTDAVKDLINTNQIGIPVVQVRELDSVVRIKNGDTMVIGGMIDQRSQNDDKGVPFLGKLPFAGNLFKTVDKISNVVETVVFLKATIIEGTPFDQNDKELYEKFISDPRPIDL
jgi:MSHA type pilus biogenesis protein MshL